MKHNSRLALPTALFLGIAASALSAYREYAEPPPGDPCLTNRFGRSWSDPIFKGFLVADGEYVDAPYVVEQRGYKVFVNNVQVERVNPLCVLPRPFTPLAEDPGMPTDLTRSSSLAEMTMHPILLRKNRHWDHLGLRGAERIRRQIDYFKAMPNVADAVETDPMCGNTMLTLTDHRGNSLGIMIQTEPYVPKPIPEPELHRMAVHSRRYVAGILRLNGLLLADNGCVFSHGTGAVNVPRLREIVGTLEGVFSIEEKVRQLKVLGHVPKHLDVERAATYYHIRDFRGSDQLRIRLSEDESWRDGTDQVPHALTNGWRRIQPKFVREKQQRPTDADQGASGAVSNVAERADTRGSVTDTGSQTSMPSGSEGSPSNDGQRVRVAVLAGIAVLLAVSVFMLKKARRMNPDGG